MHGTHLVWSFFLKNPTVKDLEKNWLKSWTSLSTFSPVCDGARLSLIDIKDNIQEPKFIESCTNTKIETFVRVNSDEQNWLKKLSLHIQSILGWLLLIKISFDDLFFLNYFLTISYYCLRITTAGYIDLILFLKHTLRSVLSTGIFYFNFFVKQM